MSITKLLSYVLLSCLVVGGITAAGISLWRTITTERDASFYIANPQLARDTIQKCLSEANLARAEGNKELAMTLTQRPECVAAITTKRAWNDYSQYCQEGFDPLQSHLCDKPQ